MSGSTRRGFVQNSAVTAAGMTVSGHLWPSRPTPRSPPPTSGPVVAYVRDAKTGDISVMSGEREVKVQNRKLAAAYRSRRALICGRPQLDPTPSQH